MGGTPSRRRGWASRRPRRPAAPPSRAWGRRRPRPTRRPARRPAGCEMEWVPGGWTRRENTLHGHNDPAPAVRRPPTPPVPRPAPDRRTARSRRAAGPCPRSARNRHPPPRGRARPSPVSRGSRTTRSGPGVSSAQGSCHRVTGASEVAGSGLGRPWAGLCEPGGWAGRGGSRRGAAQGGSSDLTSHPIPAARARSHPDRRSSRRGKTLGPTALPGYNAGVRARRD